METGAENPPGVEKDLTWLAGDGLGFPFIERVFGL